MVVRIAWNIGAGLLHRAVNKSGIRLGLGLQYPSIWRARPGFLDCDINLHLNNASYLSNMELARWHFCAVTGILGNVWRHRRSLVVASQAVRYRHPIRPLQPYEIRSQLVFADDDGVYLLHRFQCPTTRKLYAEGLCRASYRRNDDANTSVSKVLNEVFGEEIEMADEMPDMVKELMEWDAATPVVIETPAEAVRREKETVMSSDSWRSKASETWNLPL